MLRLNYCNLKCNYFLKQICNSVHYARTWNGYKSPDKQTYSSCWSNEALLPINYLNISARQGAENIKTSNLQLFGRRTSVHWPSVKLNFYKRNIVTIQCIRSLSTKSEGEAKSFKLPRPEHLKKAMKEYGSTVIGFHVVLSLASLQICYILVKRGIDVMAILDYVGYSSTTISNNIASGASTFVIAYAVHKILAPLRIGITLGVTPFIVRYLRKKGFLKPVSIK